MFTEACGFSGPCQPPAGQNWKREASSDAGMVRISSAHRCALWVHALISPEAVHYCMEVCKARPAVLVAVMVAVSGGTASGSRERPRTGALTRAPVQTRRLLRLRLVIKGAHKDTLVP